MPSSREFRFAIHPSGRVLWADRPAQALDIQPEAALAGLCLEPAQLLRILSAEGTSGPWALSLRGLEGARHTWVWVERGDEVLHVLGREVSLEEVQLCQQLQREQEELAQLRRHARQQQRELERGQRELGRLACSLDQATRALRSLHAEVVCQDVSLGAPGEVQPRWRARLAHELQTPLHSISATTGVLLKELTEPLSAEQESLLRQLQDASEALAARVALQLLSSSSDPGARELQLGETSVPELFVALRGMLAAHPVPAGVELVFEGACVGGLQTDAGKVLEILRHYVTNALKCTDEGKVCVSARAVEPGLVLFSVSDTGVGIEAEQQARLFRACMHVPGQGSRQGLGLGLALVRRLAGQLGGTPLLTSAPGRGSRFYLSVPREHPLVAHQNSMTMPTREGVERSSSASRR